MKQINYTKADNPEYPPMCSLSISLIKVGQVVRIAHGADIRKSILNITHCGFSEGVFQMQLAERSPADVAYRAFVGAVVIRLIVYSQREKREEVTARAQSTAAHVGATPEDSKALYRPGIFRTTSFWRRPKRLTMNSRPKQPKYARNNKTS